MSLRCAITILALAAATAVSWTPRTEAKSARAARADSAATSAPAARADAAALYNAGTDALSRGDLGHAVAFLLAARRIDPRARDIRTNLAIARARVEEVQGSGEHGPIRPPSALALTAAEAGWLSAALALAGALLVWAASRNEGSRRLFIGGTATFAAGVLFCGALLLRAREEARHPEAVVVAKVLNVGRAPDERPLPPYLLVAGEVVRIGRVRNDLVEVRVSGNSIGWAQRSGLWRVAEAARYTAKSESQ
ncbi:MAG TPA: hypothetical protein VGJ98_02320 [Candidatus Eisenbacteria bacterium]